MRLITELGVYVRALDAGALLAACHGRYKRSTTAAYISGADATIMMFVAPVAARGELAARSGYAIRVSEYECLDGLAIVMQDFNDFWMIGGVLFTDYCL